MIFNQILNCQWFYARFFSEIKSRRFLEDIVTLSQHFWKILWILMNFNTASKTTILVGNNWFYKNRNIFWRKLQQLFLSSFLKYFHQSWKNQNNKSNFMPSLLTNFCFFSTFILTYAKKIAKFLPSILSLKPSQFLGNFFFFKSENSVRRNTKSKASTAHNSSQKYGRLFWGQKRGWSERAIRATPHYHW